MKQHLEVGDHVKDRTQNSNEGIVVRVEIGKSVEDHGAVWVWQMNRENYGIDNCEHYVEFGWEKSLKLIRGVNSPTQDDVEFFSDCLSASHRNGKEIHRQLKEAQDEITREKRSNAIIRDKFGRYLDNFWRFRTPTPGEIIGQWDDAREAADAALKENVKPSFDSGLKMGDECNCSSKLQQHRCAIHPECLYFHGKSSK